MTEPWPAAQGRFQRCLAEVLDIEGGYSNRPLRADPGGATMCGVTWRTYNDYRASRGLPPRDVRQIERHEILDIYWGQYWTPAGCEHMPAGLDLAVFDFAVNSGPVTAMKHLQRALGVHADGHFGYETAGAIRSAFLPNLIRRYLAERRRFGRSLRNYPQNPGWERRWDRIERRALEDAGAQQWAAAVTFEPPPADPDARSAEQGRAEPHDPIPPWKTEITLGGGGTFGVGNAISNAFNRMFMQGQVSARAFVMALLGDPLFWVGVIAVAGGVYTFLWRRAHR